MILDYATIKVGKPHPHVILVTLDRPRTANAINTQMAKDLYALFSALARDEVDIRALVLTGAGEKVFCAGGDLKERNGMTDEQWSHQHEIMEKALFELHDVPVPVIAAINGAAFGGGCELALAADFAYASEEARFALTETSLGIMPGAGGTQNLPRAVGLKRANEIILTAIPFSAHEAMEWGVVNRLYPGEVLLEKTLAIAGRIAENAPLAIRQAKRAMRAGLDMEKRAALQHEIDLYHELISSEDRHEGVKAFNEKRKPVFRGT
ncbi:enoyl-CoA hydratase-related protein [Hyphococcus flavus]|uniref:Enoyl-CoA hydratase-related protein n=1 Tax=Hyphococcus flavus TaxID=1866326 RepID=A0AAE9ZFY2_9PROT|nr:enoyl-CoA hydratase-related protein [Hyphococcus flavus]WDI30111.1 enoyl-CoA hydratase-related protein [Hyphococcus flavus]